MNPSPLASNSEETDSEMLDHLRRETFDFFVKRRAL
jgi:hypothetical protein